MVDENTISLRVTNYKNGAFKYQERRHEQWRENYSLYRDNVITNRLTQRQSVNMPLMKETIRTLLAKTDEFPELYFTDRSGNKQNEIFMNEYWKWTVNADKFEIKDIVDKKQVGLYGRSAIKLNIFDGRITFEVLEAYDWLVDRYADPADIDNTASYMCHQNIYRTISQLKANPFYDQTVVTEISTEYASTMGVQKSEENYEAMMAKNQRLEDLGLADSEAPEVGETIVDLTEHYIKLWCEKEKRIKIFVRTTGGNSKVLLHKPLEEVLGINFFPITSWADDVEKTDLWSDGVGDVVRTPNKVLNAWFSQMVENRTLRNYGMNYYDATGKDAFIPQTFQPTPWGWYPINGNPNDKIKRVDIPDLSESIDEMNFIIGMTEKSTASTSTEKGVAQKGNVTLGEIEIIRQNSGERIASIAKFYNPARKDLGEKFWKIVRANKDILKEVELEKTSSTGKVFVEKVKPADFVTETGFTVTVESSSERDAKTIAEVQKLRVIKQEFPNNKALQKIMKKKMLGMVELSSEDIQSVMDEEETAPLAPAGGQPIPSPFPGVAGASIPK